MADDGNLGSGYARDMDTKEHHLDDVARNAAVTRAGALKVMGSILLLAFLPLKRAEARPVILTTYCDVGTLENCVGGLGSSSRPLECVGQPQNVAICRDPNLIYYGCWYSSTEQDPASDRLADKYMCPQLRPRCHRRPCPRR